MIRVLVVDDDVHVAAVHKGFAERVPGFEVVGVAHTAVEALDLAEQLRPDLLLLDIYLPDRSGLEVLRHLRAEGRPPFDVIAITAAKDVETLRAALHGGVAHYLVKPFQFNAFREKLESYAAARARLQGMRELDQPGVDRIVALLRTEARAELPKGVSGATLDLVARSLRDATHDLSAAEIASLTGLSRVTARRYVDHLVRAGSVELTMRYGATGRPEHRYRWLAREGAAAEP
jgi:two-component system CitB family response regulator